MPDSPESPVSIEDARSYVTLVKDTFGENTLGYKRFLAILRDYRTGLNDTEVVIRHVAELFSDHEELYKGFYMFLPDDMRYQMDNIRNELRGDSESFLKGPLNDPQESKSSPSEIKFNNSQRKRRNDESDNVSFQLNKERRRLPASKSPSPPQKSRDQPPSPNQLLHNSTTTKTQQNFCRPEIILFNKDSTEVKNLTDSLLFHPDPLSVDAITSYTSKNVACKICEGRRNTIANAENEPILLCELKGCNAEYHLKCLDPNLFCSKNWIGTTRKCKETGYTDLSPVISESSPFSQQAGNTSASSSATAADTDPVRSPQIPDGDIYCTECATDGSTAVLRKYFDRCDYVRSHFSCSRAYVMRLLEQHMKEHPQGNYVAAADADIAVTGDGNDIATYSSSKELLPPPRSELWYVNELYRLALMDPSTTGNGAVQSKELYGMSNAAIKNKMTFNDSAEFLIGKPVRLYCPLDNNYHVGRIIDFRTCSVYPSLRGNGDHVAASVDPKTNTVHIEDLDYYGIGPISQSEFLVRFPAGVEGRKKELVQWIILEEHSLAVGVSLIHGKTAKLKGKVNGWKPAMILARSALELVPVREFLYENDKGELFASMNRDASFGRSFLSTGASKNDDGLRDRWALASFFGEEAHGLLHLRDEAKALFTTNENGKTAKPLKSGGVHSSRSPMGLGAEDVTHPYSSSTLDIPMGLAIVEHDEQVRCREWFKLILRNPAHPLALTSCDEYSVPLVVNRRGENNDGNDVRDGSNIRVQFGKLQDLNERDNPLIERGIDRLRLAHLVEAMSEPLDQSRDTLLSFSCEKVTSMSKAMATLQHR